jgi:hypothetical protein
MDNNAMRMVCFFSKAKDRRASRVGDFCRQAGLITNGRRPIDVAHHKTREGQAGGVLGRRYAYLAVHAAYSPKLPLQIHGLQPLDVLPHAHQIESSDRRRSIDVGGMPVEGGFKRVEPQYVPGGNNHVGYRQRLGYGSSFGSPQAVFHARCNLGKGKLTGSIGNGHVNYLVGSVVQGDNYLADARPIGIDHLAA